MDADTRVTGAPQESGAFLAFTDLHFDPFFDPSLVKALIQAPSEQWEGIFAGSTITAPSGYGENANYPLFKSLLDDMAPHAGEVSFVMMTGDLLTHKFRERYAAATGDDSPEGLRAFAAKTVEFAARETAARFPNDPVYFAIGNNDSLSGDYQVKPGGAFLRDSGAIFDRYWIEDPEDSAAFSSTYPEGGYYSLTPEGTPGLRLVVLNAPLMSASRQGGDEAGDVQLRWLADELSRATANHEKVWLVSHIPLGVDAYQTITRARSPEDVKAVTFLKAPFNQALIDQSAAHAGDIAAEFAGHIHRDDFRFVTAPSGEVLTEMFVMPSVSPAYGNNPAYKKFVFDEKTGAILDVSTYILDLAAQTSGQASGQPSAASPAWKLEYSLAEAYGLAREGAIDWTAFAADLLRVPAAREHFARFYDADAGNGNQIAPANYDAFWLALTHLTGADYDAAYAAMLRGEAIGTLDAPTPVEAVLAGRGVLGAFAPGR